MPDARRVYLRRLLAGHPFARSRNCFSTDRKLESSNRSSGRHEAYIAEERSHSDLAADFPNPHFENARSKDESPRRPTCTTRPVLPSVYISTGRTNPPSGIRPASCSSPPGVAAFDTEVVELS